MEIGHTINALLYACWALSLAGALNVFFSKSIKDSGVKHIVLIMGIAASSWSLFSGALGFSEMENMSKVCFSLLIISFDIYALTLWMFVGRLVEIESKSFKAFLAAGMVLTVLDIFIFAFGNNHEYVRVHGRTAYYTSFSWGLVYHFMFISFMLFALIILGMKYARRSKLRRKREFVVRTAIINIVLLIFAIPDTVFPVFGIPSFPSSGFAIMATFISLVMLAQKNNTFSISQRNLTEAIYNQGKIGVLVVESGKVVSGMNAFAAKLLDIDQTGKYDLSDVISATDEQINMIVSGEEIHEHIKSAKTNIPMSIYSVVYRDKYGDPYGVALMLVDATAEERVAEQLLEIKIAIEKREGIEKLSHQLVSALSKSIDAKDEYTNGHSHRVAQYSVMIAKRMGYDEDQVRQMEYSALLHDVGKIGVPNAIINKPGKLTDEEYDIIKKHPAIGDNILRDIMEIPQIRIGARWHHERVDGRGYPDGLKGNDIPELARIIAMADAYDAMTSNRSYRQYLPQDVVRAEIEKNRGLQFDEKIADIMLQIIDDDVQYELHEPGLDMN